MAEYIRIDKNTYAGQAQYIMKSEIETFGAYDNFGGQHHQHVVVQTKSGKRVQTELFMKEFLDQLNA